MELGMSRGGSLASLPEPHLASKRSRRGSGDGSTRVIDDPWDWNAWQALLGEVTSRPFAQGVTDYERFLDIYPTYAKGWKHYAEHAARASSESGREAVQDYTKAQAHQPDDSVKPVTIYERALVYCKTNVELWKSFLSYLKKYGSRDAILKAFDQAVSNCGLEPSSHGIWNDYISFISKGHGGRGPEDQVTRDLLRKVYQRAVKSPIQNLETFWREYEEFENKGSNPDFAKGILAELGPLNKSARAEFRARKYRRDGLVLNSVAFPPRGKPKEEEQSKLWKKYVLGEASNPHELEASELGKRVIYAHELSLVCLYRYPDAWIEASMYFREIEKLDEAEAVLHRGINAVPASPLLHFALVNLLELQSRKEEARTCFENLIQKAPSPLVYIEYMKFSRRAEGIAAARKIFARARKDQHSCTYQVFVAAARLEYHVNKLPKIARNIYELGMKLFPTSVDYASAYIDFLWNLSEESAIKFLIERVLAELPKSVDARRIWDKRMEFEFTFGDAASIEAVEKRRAAALADGKSSGDEVLGLIARTTMMDLTPVTHQEMNAIKSRSTVPQSSARTDTNERGNTGGSSKDTKSRDRDGGHSRGGGKGNDDNLAFRRSLESLVRMFPKPSHQPTPPVQFVLDRIRETPASFAETQIAKTSGEGTGSSGTGSRKRKSDATGRGDSESGSKVVPEPVHKAPPQDIFRSRHAQKLSKLK
ncbi:hypothetical protein NDN08_001378 [Rhodosorus marinus]|uniref:Suppressor of forked domain-containing protein n=1 Tax=Rhodosorus marinus TaxID=101924 RepID=A0AAV8UQL5_9RHOD|nr:hypothetical protein NDN08_001378 [Rhodosorus marinus]